MSFELQERDKKKGNVSGLEELDCNERGLEEQQKKLKIKKTVVGKSVFSISSIMENTDHYKNLDRKI